MIPDLPLDSLSRLLAPKFLVDLLAALIKSLIGPLHTEKDTNVPEPPLASLVQFVPIICLRHLPVFNCFQNLLFVLKEHIVLQFLQFTVLFPDTYLALPVIQNTQLDLLFQPVNLVVRA